MLLTTYRKSSETNPSRERRPERQRASATPDGGNEKEIQRERKESRLTFEHKKGADKNQAEDCPHHGDARDVPLAKESSLFAIKALTLILHT